MLLGEQGEKNILVTGMMDSAYREEIAFHLPKRNRDECRIPRAVSYHHVIEQQKLMKNYSSPSRLTHGNWDPPVGKKFCVIQVAKDPTPGITMLAGDEGKVKCATEGWNYNYHLCPITSISILATSCIDLYILTHVLFLSYVFPVPF